MTPTNAKLYGIPTDYLQVLPKRVPDHQRVVREDGKIQLILQEFSGSMQGSDEVMTA